jgi:hypothetical protein
MIMIPKIAAAVLVVLLTTYDLKEQEIQIE